MLGLALSPDGKTLAAGCSDGMVYLWDVAARTLRIPPFRALQSANKWYLAFSKDGRLVVTPSPTGRLLWDVATGRPTGPTFENPARTNSVALNPDGRLLLIGSSDGSARLWDPVTGLPLTSPLKWHSDRVRHVAFSPDGELFLTASTDRTARLWDAVTGRPLGLPLQHQASVRSVVFSPDGMSFLTTSGDGGVRLWELAVHDPVRLVFESPAYFSADSKSIVTTDGNSVQIRDAATGDPRGSSFQVPGPPTVAAFGQSGNDILALTRDSDGAVRLWNASTRKLACVLAGPSNQVLDPLALSPDGKTIVTGRKEVIRLWEASTGQPIGRPLQHSGDVSYSTFSLDGRTVATSYGPNSIRVWDAGTGAALGEPFSYPGSADAIALSPNGTLLAVGGEDGTAWIWDVRTRKPLFSPLVHGGWIWTVAFSRDGKFLATGSGDSTARVWDVATGQPIGPAFRHPGSVHHVSFSPDGKYLITRDNLTRVFQLEPELPDDLVPMANWAEVLTGLTLEPKQGAFRLLDNESWLASYVRLLRGGGPPQTESSPRPHPHPLGIDLAARGQALVERGWWAEAEAAFSKLIGARPEDSSRWVTRGEFHLRRGQYQKAAADFRSAAERDPDNPQFHYLVCIARLLGGDMAGYRAACRDDEAIPDVRNTPCREPHGLRQYLCSGRRPGPGPLDPDRREIRSCLRRGRANRGCRALWRGTV